MKREMIHTSKSTFASFALIGGAFLLNACTIIGPDYEPPQTAAFEEPSFINEAPYDETEPLATWWTAFDDSILAGLVSTGIDQNRSLAAAYANVNASRAQLGVARLNRLPFDTITASYQESRTASSVFAASTGQGADVGPFPTNDISDLNISASWEVDLFGRVTRTINIAKADLGQAQALLADLQTVLIADIVDAYVNVRGLEAQLTVAVNNAENQAETLRLTETIRDAGRGTDFDVERAKAQLSATRASIPPLETAAAAARYQLAVLTGQTPSQIEVLLADTAPLPIIAGPLSVGDPASFLRRRPDIAVSERALAAATENVGLNLTNAFPRINLVGAVGFQSIGFDDAFSENALNFNVGPSITWSLTDLLRAKDRVAGANASAQAAFAEYEQTILVALAEVESALVQQANLQRQLTELTEAERASAAASRLARLRYENGASDFLSVLDAERRELEAADQLAAIRTATARAQVSLFRALRAGPALSESRKPAVVE